MDFSKKKFHIASYLNGGQFLSRLNKLLRKVQTRSYLHWMACILTINSKDVSSSKESHSNVFGIEPDILISIVQERVKPSKFGGIEGIARRLHVRLDKGVCYLEHPTIKVRKSCYGSNRYYENSNMSFWTFVWKELRARTISFIICVLVSMCLEAFIDGWPKGLSIFLVIIFTAATIYKHYLLFRNLTTEKKIEVLVTRAGNPERVSKYDLVVGDIIHLCTGDQVPADGLFIQGRELLIEESRFTGESELVNINSKTPHFLSGSVVKEGSGKMLVTSVGKNTEQGRMMGSVNEWREDETPLPTLLNDVATSVGWICLVLSILAMYWTVVTIGVPLASTLNLTLMKERVHVRNPSVGEIMGDSICLDKTGTLTSSHIVVNKTWIWDKVKKPNGDKVTVSHSVLRTLVQSNYMNTSAEVVEKNGKKTPVGSPTESTLLEYALFSGAEIGDQYREARSEDVVPFNSIRKIMSVLVTLPAGGIRVICKGAPENILALCEKMVHCNGESGFLSIEKGNDVMNVINEFCIAGLRTLYFAYQEVTEALHTIKIPESGYTLIAVAAISIPLCPGVEEALKACFSAGISVWMITGDNMDITKAVPRESAILMDDDLAIGGPNICDIDSLDKLITKIQVMAHSLPCNKRESGTLLKNIYGEVVYVTCDGFNDAPALQVADIRLAMGIAGAESRGYKNGMRCYHIGR